MVFDSPISLQLSFSHWLERKVGVSICSLFPSVWCGLAAARETLSEAIFPQNPPSWTGEDPKSWLAGELSTPVRPEAIVKRHHQAQLLDGLVGIGSNIALF
jgi:hypothetical protein